MSIETAVVNGTSPTTAGTKSFEVSGFGTPQAAIVTLSRADSGTNPVDDIRIAIGFTDGTTSGYCSVCSNDAEITSDTNRVGKIDGVISSVSHTNTITMLAAFDSWATNGITLDFTTVASVAYNMSITLIKGCTNAYVGVATLSSLGANDITAPGFKGNLLYMATIGADTHAAFSNSILSFGAAHNSSTDTVTQGAVLFSNVNGEATDNLSIVTRDDACVGQLHDGSIAWLGSAESFDSSGFSINTTVSPNSDLVYYLLLDTGDTNGVDVSIVNSPTSTGTWNVEDAGFTPQHVMLGLTTCATTNTVLAADPMSLGLSMFDDSTESCCAVDADYGASTTNNQSNYSSSNGVEMYEFGGSTHDLMHQGSFTSFDSLGYNFSFPTYVDGTTRRWLSIAIKDASEVSSIIPQVAHHYRANSR